MFPFLSSYRIKGVLIQIDEISTLAKDFGQIRIFFYYLK